MCAIFLSYKIAARVSLPVAMATVSLRTECVMVLTTVETVLTSVHALKHWRKASTGWDSIPPKTDAADLAKPSIAVRHFPEFCVRHDTFALT